jgi:hypothetical protein
MVAAVSNRAMTIASWVCPNRVDPPTGGRKKNVYKIKRWPVVWNDPDHRTVPDGIQAEKYTYEGWNDTGNKKEENNIYYSGEREKKKTSGSYLFQQQLNVGAYRRPIDVTAMSRPTQ